ncbi:DNA photolyase phr1, partial [Elasticomyces elasticus]
MPATIRKRKAPSTTTIPSPRKRPAGTQSTFAAARRTVDEQHVNPEASEPSDQLQDALTDSVDDGVNNEPATGDSHVEERLGIVQREFYPPEMGNARCAMYNNNELPRPLQVLNTTIKDTAAARSKIEVGEAVVHWFKRDLRTNDNRALHLASEKAKSRGVPLVCMFIVSPQDYQAHLTSPARVDFELRTLQIMKQDLAEKDIPLYVETRENRKAIPAHIVDLCEKWRAKHIFCNIEYEVDELRRETKMTKMCLERGIDFSAVHDDVVVPPETLTTGQGKQYSVYTPWRRAWVAHVHSNPKILDTYEPPGQNPPSARDKLKDAFEMPIPAAPSNKSLTEEEKTRFSSLWPAGEHEASDRLDRFLDEKVGRYKEARNFPASNSTAMISVHLSSGTLAARTAVRRARDVNSTKKLDGGNEGL